MSQIPRTRIRRSQAEKRHLLDEWAASGLSGRAFAAKVDTCAPNLWRWRHELASSSSALIPVVLRSTSAVEPVASEVTSPRLELVCHGGRVVRIYAGCDQALLRAVVSVAEETASC